VRSYSWAKRRLQEPGLVAKAAGRGKHRNRLDNSTPQLAPATAPVTIVVLPSREKDPSRYSAGTYVQSKIRSFRKKLRDSDAYV